MNENDYNDLFIESFQNNKKHKGYSEYGSSVMPILEEYKKLNDYEARLAFKNALEKMLRDESEDLRSFGVTICLGFYVFRDAI